MLYRIIIFIIILSKYKLLLCLNIILFLLLINKFIINKTKTIFYNY